ncbi:hypothetical protein RUM44_012328 [Polyplax serrata]|uniref:Uncharacterized protein n=1 Tax=Polyplax serrata TaxID=468196 RepID=A0ABR1BF85_POLSC
MSWDVTPPISGVLDRAETSCGDSVVFMWCVLVLSGAPLSGRSHITRTQPVYFRVFSYHTNYGSAGGSSQYANS